MCLFQNELLFLTIGKTYKTSVLDSRGIVVVRYFSYVAHDPLWLDKYVFFYQSCPRTYASSFPRSTPMSQWIEELSVYELYIHILVSLFHEFNGGMVVTERVTDSNPMKQTNLIYLKTIFLRLLNPHSLALAF